MCLCVLLLLQQPKLLLLSTEAFVLTSEARHLTMVRSGFFRRLAKLLLSISWRSRLQPQQKRWPQKEVAPLELRTFRLVIWQLYVGQQQFFARGIIF